jgi:hypothetical protein
MRVRVQHLPRAIAAALVAAAVLAGTAQADRPDDRARMLGVGAISSAVATPDVFERAAIRAMRDGVVRPDDRPGLRGVGGIASVPAVPDAFERAVLRLAMPVRPNDRGGLQGPGSVATGVPSVTSVSDGFQWSDAAFGAAAAFGFVLLAGAAALTIRHRSRVILS